MSITVRVCNNGPVVSRYMKLGPAINVTVWPPFYLSQGIGASGALVTSNRITIDQPVKVFNIQNTTGLIESKTYYTSSVQISYNLTYFLLSETIGGGSVAFNTDGTPGTLNMVFKTTQGGYEDPNQYNTLVPNLNIVVGGWDEPVFGRNNYDVISITKMTGGEFYAGSQEMQTIAWTNGFQSFGSFSYPWKIKMHFEGPGDPDYEAIWANIETMVLDKISGDPVIFHYSTSKVELIDHESLGYVEGGAVRFHTIVSTPTAGADMKISEYNKYYIVNSEPNFFQLVDSYQWENGTYYSLLEGRILNPVSSNSYFSTPNIVYNLGLGFPIGDIVIKINMALLNWDGSDNPTLVAQWGGPGSSSWAFDYLNGQLRFFWTTDGTAATAGTTAVMDTLVWPLGTPVDATYAWVAVSRNSTTGEVKFWQITDTYSYLPALYNFTQVGSTIVKDTGNWFVSTGPLTVGNRVSPDIYSLNGKVKEMFVAPSDGGQGSVRFRSQDYRYGPTWTSIPTGETWTKNGSATFYSPNISPLTYGSDGTAQIYREN